MQLKKSWVYWICFPMKNIQKPKKLAVSSTAHKHIHGETNQINFEEGKQWLAIYSNPFKILSLSDMAEFQFKTEWNCRSTDPKCDQ